MPTAPASSSLPTASASLPVYSAGLGPLLDAVCERTGGVLNNSSARRIRRLIGDRYTVIVSDIGIRTHGVVRTHHVRWADVDHVEMEPVTQMAARRVIGRVAARTAARAVPIPGLHWLAQKVVNTVVDPAASLTADVAGSVASEGPAVFAAARASDGGGVDLDGVMALTAMLSPGLTRVVREQAAIHQVPIRS